MKATSHWLLKKRHTKLVTGIIFMLSVFNLSALAYNHDIDAEEIGLNDFRVGIISPATPEQTYILTARAGLSVEFDILVAEGNLNPALSITLNHVPLDILTGLDSERRLKSTFTFEEAAAYALTISGLDENGGIFGFVIREALQARENVPLTMGTSQTYSLARSESVKLDILADPQVPLIVNVKVDNTTRSASVTLKMADGSVIGSIGTAIFGGGFMIPAGIEIYTLEIQNTATGSIPIDCEVSVVQQT